ncbi:MAG: hypothetical protein GWN18_20490, partial [Thermoplasmata archaeon]|nr:hypothetical protein [Thermoplasmata archaeon]
MDVFVMESKEEYEWTLMILQPEEVTMAMFEEACQEVREKKGLDSVDRLRLENYHEGSSAQVMHVGPYADEA